MFMILSEIGDEKQMIDNVKILPSLFGCVWLWFSECISSIRVNDILFYAISTLKSKGSVTKM